MGKVTLEKKSVGGFRRAVFKFDDEKLVCKFEDLTSAAKDAGTSVSGLSNYMNGKQKKATKIPVNIEYGFTARFPKKEEE